MAEDRAWGRALAALVGQELAREDFDKALDSLVEAVRREGVTISALNTSLGAYLTSSVSTQRGTALTVLAKVSQAACWSCSGGVAAFACGPGVGGRGEQAVHPAANEPGVGAHGTVCGIPSCRS